MLPFTDGLTEARRLSLGSAATTRTGAFLGLDGLSCLARQAWKPEASLQQISEAIFEGARHFSGGSFHDDVCLITGQKEVYNVTL